MVDKSVNYPSRETRFEQDLLMLSGFASREYELTQEEAAEVLRNHAEDLENGRWNILFQRYNEEIE